MFLPTTIQTRGFSVTPRLSVTKTATLVADEQVRNMPSDMVCDVVKF